MNTRSQILAAWCGPAFMAIMSVGWVMIAGYFPPHLPSFTGQEVAAFYSPENILSIRFGLLLTLWGSALYIPFSTIITLKMMRIEGKCPIWSWSQLAAGAGTTLTLAFPVMFWATAAFRPDRSPELLQLLDDLGWIPFAGMTVPFLLQPLCIAAVGLMDKSKNPLFPRWFCFFNLWADLLILPGGLIIFFHSGPFAWSGLFGIWVPFIAFGAWFCLMTYFLIKGIRREALEEPTANPLL